MKGEGEKEGGGEEEERWEAGICTYMPSIAWQIPPVACFCGDTILHSCPVTVGDMSVCVLCDCGGYVRCVCAV